MELTIRQQKVLSLMSNQVAMRCEDIINERLVKIGRYVSAINSVIALLDPNGTSEPRESTPDLDRQIVALLRKVPGRWFKPTDSIDVRLGRTMDTAPAQTLSNESTELPDPAFDWAMRILPKEPLSLAEYAEKHCKISLEYYASETAELRANLTAFKDLTQGTKAMASSSNKHLWEFCILAKEYYQVDHILSLKNIFK